MAPKFARVVWGCCLLTATHAAAQDLDGDGQPDSAQLRAGGADCNLNGLLDGVDLGRPHFATAIEHLNGLHAFQNNVWDLCPIDFDLDGRTDLALCAFTSTNFGHVALWRNHGGPGLVFHAEIPFPEGRPTIVRAADLNADGLADLVAADSSYGRVYLLFGQGAGAFAPAVTLDTPSGNNGSVGMALGDLDADGDVDVAVTCWGTDSVAVLLNDGAGNFGPANAYPTGFQPRDVAIADFTGDGLADLAVANEFESAQPPAANGTVSLLRNTGAGVFTPHADIEMPRGNQPYEYQARPQFVELADLDHDGDTDLITSSDRSNTLSVHHNDGAGGFTLGQRFGGVSIEGEARDLVVADFDQDGWEDVVWGDQAQNTAAVFANDAGTLALRQNFATSIYGSRYLAVADFSGDGLPDLVSANDSARTFSVLVNTGGLGFDAPIHLRPDEFPQPPVFADFDGDGLTDLGTLRSGPDPAEPVFSVYPGLGGAVFAREPTDTAVLPGVFRAFDLDEDGAVDLLSTGGHCRVYLGRGDGTFEPPLASALSVVTLRSVVADLDLDGVLDLAWIDPGHPGDYRVSLGDGAGGFGPADTYVMHREDESVGVGDVTGDGAPELFAGFRPLGNPPGGILSWLPNNGDGTFGPRQDRFIPDTPLSPKVDAIAVADFDADGDADVAVGARGLRVFDNPGDGDLPATPRPVHHAGISTLLVADADLDGDPDLFAQGAAGMLFLNDGAGGFEPPMSFHRYDSNARSIVVTDADNNGRPDLVVNPENSWGAYLYLNHPAWSTDADGDGVPDDCAPACPSDLAEPAGTTDFYDLFTFLSYYNAQDPRADLAAPDGVFNFFDAAAFLSAFIEGCE